MQQTSLKIFLLVILLGGCKKEEVVKETSFFAGNCRIYSVSLDFATLSGYFKYGVGKVFKGVGINEKSDTLGYRCVFVDGQLTEINYDNNGKEYPSYRFEYGVNGLELIRAYSTKYNFSGLNGTVPPETGRYKFEYGKPGKPVSMQLFFNSSDSTNLDRDFKAADYYDFEYDDAGNLSKETHSFLNQQGKLEVAFTMNHTYDNKVNALRQLNYLYFDMYSFAPYMFSRNNKIATITTRPGEAPFEQKFKMEYDSEGNVTDDGQRFSYIKWFCD